MAIDRELLKGTLPMLVLSQLAAEEQYGYQLIKNLAEGSGGVFTFKEGTLYPVLHALERDGLVSSFWDGREGGRRRRYYEITAFGMANLESRRAEWQRLVDAVAAIAEVKS